jgi:YHS domain-containing protein
MSNRTRRHAVRGALSILIALGSSFAAAAGDTESASPAAAAAASDAEFDGECVMGLALGKEIKTDCSVSTVYGGRTYCFGNETAKQLFLKKPDEFLLQAHVYYSSKQPAPGDSGNPSKPGE